MSMKCRAVGRYNLELPVSFDEFPVVVILHVVTFLVLRMMTSSSALCRPVSVELARSNNAINSAWPNPCSFAAPSSVVEAALHVGQARPCSSSTTSMVFWEMFRRCTCFPWLCRRHWRHRYGELQVGMLSHATYRSSRTTLKCCARMLRRLDCWQRHTLRPRIIVLPGSRPAMDIELSREGECVGLLSLSRIGVSRHVLVVLGWLRRSPLGVTDELAGWAG